MSWRRAFSRVYEQYCWLKSFAKINKIAIDTALKETVKTLMLEGEKSKFFAKVNKCLDVMPLYHSKQSTKKVKQLVEDFAKMFTGKDFHSAIAELNSTRTTIRSKDLIPIALLTGVNLTLAFVQMLTLALPQ